MKRAILTAVFAIGLSALFVACGGSSGGSSNATPPPNACTSPGAVQTTCGCYPQTAVPPSCTITGYGNSQFGYNPQYGNPNFGNPIAYPANQTPQCAYTGTCFYVSQPGQYQIGPQVRYVTPGYYYYGGAAPAYAYGYPGYGYGPGLSVGIGVQFNFGARR